MSTLLLLSLLVFSAVGFAEPAKNAEAAIPAADSSVVAPPTVEAPRGGLSLFDQSDAAAIPGADRVCLKIRAFIFETNDDQVPRFVRETTCLPASGGVKKVNGRAQPKLIPATSGNQF